MGDLFAEYDVKNHCWHVYRIEVIGGIQHCSPSLATFDLEWQMNGYLAAKSLRPQTKKK